MTEFEWAIIDKTEGCEIIQPKIKVTITTKNDKFSLLVIQDENWRESVSKLVETISPIVEEIKCEII